VTDAQPEPDVEVREGDVLAGKYRVEQVLGQGGMGVVVAATHTVLHNKVALKFLLPSVAKHKQTAARFLREAQAAVKIKSPHVARVIDVGEMEDTGSPYMVMEFLEGRDLGQILEQQGALEIDFACMLMLQACEALAAAHASGIVHRDVKPANLFVTSAPDGSPLVKVLDFGISKNVVDMGISNLTQTQTSMGSPLYMSPEQMRSARDVDARTDIWSLGVVLFEALTGQMPFMAETMPQLVALVLEEKAPRMDTLRPDLPPALVQAVSRCLQKNRDERFRHVALLAEAIAPFAPSGGMLSAERTSRIVTGAGLDRTAEVPSSDSLGVAQDVGVVAPPPKMRATETAFGRTGGGASIAPRRVSSGVWIGAAGAVIAVAAVTALVISSGGEPAASSAAVSSHATQMLLPEPQPKATTEPSVVSAPSASVVGSTTEPTATPPSTASAAPSVSERTPEVAPAETQSAEQPKGKPAPQAPRRPASRPVEKKPKQSDPFGDRF
jgi:serine/threonine-protein kinase